jgi:hypothetical protein
MAEIVSVRYNVWFAHFGPGPCPVAEGVCDIKTVLKLYQCKDNVPKYIYKQQEAKSYGLIVRCKDAKRF